MSTITVPKPDVTSEEVAAVLRQGLGPRYNVQSGTNVSRNPSCNPWRTQRPDHPDTIVVGTGSNRLFRTQVTMSRNASETTLDVSPGGLWGWPRLTSALWIARKVRVALRAAPSLR